MSPVPGLAHMETLPVLAVNPLSQKQKGLTKQSSVPAFGLIKGLERKGTITQPISGSQSRAKAAPLGSLCMSKSQSEATMLASRKLQNLDFTEAAVAIQGRAKFGQARQSQESEQPADKKKLGPSLEIPTPPLDVERL